MRKIDIGVVLLALLVRVLLGNGPYSGAGIGPLFGDFEAQRHWMEITVNLPPKEWYVNSTDNDLLYWGLDYPPLTAYHSWAMGKVAEFINPKWVELFTSRGLEEATHKAFMRSTVIISELLIYIPAVFAIFNLVSKTDNPDEEFVDRWRILSALLSPGLLLIDHGHFQYNCVSLGLFLWSVYFFSRKTAFHDLLGSIAFCLTLNFKQMSLYYSLPIFVYLLQRCFRQSTYPTKFLKLSAIGVSVIVTFALLWSPFIGSQKLVLDVITRIFPVGRGIYEDKVASFWYCFSVVYKIKQHFTPDELALASAVSTFIFSTPFLWMILHNGSVKMLKYGLVNVSLVFFIYSYHVHEKTILFVSCAILLLGREETMAMVWFELIATFSLLPLMIKDGLLLPYAVLPILYFAINIPLIKENFNAKNYWGSMGFWFRRGFAVSIFGTIALSLMLLFVPSPKYFPHFYILMNCLYAFSHFTFFLFYFGYRQYTLYNEAMALESPGQPELRRSKRNLAKKTKVN